MVADIVVCLRRELVRIKVLDHAALQASTNRLLSGMTTSENFNMDNIMLLWCDLGVIVSPAIEYEIAWFEFLKFNIDW